MIYCDTRLGGVKRYVLTSEPSFLMQIPDEIRKCVGFLAYANNAGQRILAGTGFFVSYDLEDAGEGQPAFLYLITAKHVVDKIRDKGAEPLVRLNLIDGSAQWFQTNISEWKTHPDDDAVDVAALAIQFPENSPINYRRYPVNSFLTDSIIKKEEIGIGDEVFLTGLFINHYGLRANIPIVRSGNIAAMPEEKVEVKDFGLIDAYLIEARSIGGLSGSPVFVYLEPLRIKNNNLNIPVGETIPFNRFYLMGLVHGHYDVKPSPDEAATDLLDKETINMGIAIVVPSSKILEVLEQPMLKKKRQEDEARYRKQLKEKTLPTADTAEAIEPLTESGFQDALKKASTKVSEPESGKTQTSE